MSWKMTPRFKARVTRLRPLQTPPAPPASVFKDEQCIFITPDSLGEFAVKIVPSERLTIGSDKLKKGIESMPNLPPLYARRLQTLQNRASVRGYEIAKSKRRNKPILELEFKGDRNNKPSQHGVSMDSCDDDLNFPDDIIDTVAKANCAKVEPSSILPEIRASPCQIHTKRDRKTDLNVSTSHHFGKVPDSSKKKQSSVQPVSLYKDSSHGMNITVRKTVVEIPTDKDGRESEHFQVRKRPVLPKHMSSKEYVMSWLIHGSAPNGTNHFPDILPSDKTSKHRSTPRKSYLSE